MDQLASEPFADLILFIESLKLVQKNTLFPMHAYMRTLTTLLRVLQKSTLVRQVTRREVASGLKMEFKPFISWGICEFSRGKDEIRTRRSHGAGVYSL